MQSQGRVLLLLEQTEEEYSLIFLENSFTLYPSGGGGALLMRYASIRMSAGLTNSDGWMVACKKGISIQRFAPSRE